MPRFLFTCAYDGSPYLGWQSQRGGHTIQDVIEAAAARILHAPLRIAAAGRTDAGVHALAQRFHADIPDTCRMTPQNWRDALNAHLPASIRIMAAQEVPADFHARFNAVGKRYDYLICRAAVLPPFLAGRAWHLPHAFDAELLAQALHLYDGTHDFRRFAAKRGNEPDVPPADFYLRTIWSAEVCEEQGGDILRLRFHGNGFMYRMVRLLVGTAHQVARGRMSLAELAAHLTELDAPKSRFCAPADGLILDEVMYETLSCHPTE